MRDNKTVIYGSSYDRGLQHLLQMWPEVVAEVPDAKLRVFYGWDLFLRVYGNNPERLAWKEKMDKLMDLPSITHLGRISHGACIKEHKNAGIWAYPTSFGEISCITAMRSQAYGSIPVVIDYAALEETVHFGIKIHGDIYEKETREKFKNELIALLKDEKRQEEIRKEMMPWAKENFSWKKVAKQWSDEFKLPNLRKQIEDLMDDNQALKAWNLVKDTDSPLKERVWLRVKHAFNPDDYKKYYSEQLVENAVSDDLALDCTELYPRFKWLVNNILSKGYKTCVDLGCADGYLPLTLANKGLKTYGVNLYAPSIKIARERASKFNLDASFDVKDIFDAEGKYDAVVLFEILEHLPDPENAIKKCFELLNDGGSVYISTPSTEHIGITLHKENPHEGWDDSLPAGHLRIFSREELTKLLKDYKVEEWITDDQGCYLLEVKKG